MANLSDFIVNRFLTLMSGDANAQSEIVNAIQSGGSALSNIIAGTNISLSLVNGQLTINGSGGGVSTFNGLSGAIVLAAGTNITLTPSGNTITVSAAGSSGANTALSNLIATSINQSLIASVDNTSNLGSSTKSWHNLYITSIFDGANQLAIDVNNRTLTQANGTPSISWQGGVDINGQRLSSVLNPTFAQDAATKNYVDNKILVFTSTATVGGAASEAVAVTGLLASDTILSVSQKTGGGAALPILGWSTQVNNGITLIYSADMGSGAVVLVAVKR